jgi:hypothetical protein
VTRATITVVLHASAYEFDTCVELIVAAARVRS